MTGIANCRSRVDVVVGAGHPAGMLVVAFGGLDLMGNITGSIMIVWIVGYLAQLAAFMWASQTHRPRQRLIGWFIASLAPWAVGWSARSRFSIRWVAVLVGGQAW